MWTRNNDYRARRACRPKLAKTISYPHGSPTSRLTHSFSLTRLNVCPGCCMSAWSTLYAQANHHNSLSIHSLCPYFNFRKIIRKITTTVSHFQCHRTLYEKLHHPSNSDWSTSFSYLKNHLLLKTVLVLYDSI